MTILRLLLLTFKGRQVRIGINAPKSISIYRKEIYLEYRLKNKKAAEIKNVDLKEDLKDFLK